jgi:hypothetical protein
MFIHGKDDTVVIVPKANIRTNSYKKLVYAVSCTWCLVLSMGSLYSLRGSKYQRPPVCTKRVLSF